MARGLLSSCGVPVFSSLVVTQVPEHVGSVVEARELSSCGVRA